MQQLTRISIVNRALLRIGANPLQSETTPGADVYLPVYDSVTAAIIGGYPWHWAIRTRQLSRLSADAVTGQTPTSPWLHTYHLPSDLLGAPRAVYDRVDTKQATTAFELTTGLINGLETPLLRADITAAWMKYTCNAHAQWWPAHIAELITLAVAAEFALTIREDAPLRERLRRDVYGDTSSPGDSGLLGQARVLDAQAKPAQALQVSDSPLNQARQQFRWR
jgi:hypothetical protein